MTHRILFQDIQKTIEVADGITILDAAENAGVDIPSGCRKGECGTCRIRKILGDIKIVEVAGLPGEDSTKEMILSCISTPQSDLVCESTSASDETNARVLDVIQQTPDTKTFWLVLDDASFAEFVPGQFITVAPFINGKKHHRCYSISSSCLVRDHIEITIKRQGKGLVSNYFHDAVKTGDVIRVKKPQGKFKLNLKKNNALLFVASGSGITPLMSMIRSLLGMKTQREIYLLYGCRTETDIIFFKELLEMQMAFQNFSVRVFLSQPNPGWGGAIGRIDEDAIVKSLEALKGNKISLYTCGPAPVMDTAIACARNYGLPLVDCQKEHFAPPKLDIPPNFLTIEQMKSIDLFRGLGDSVLESIQPYILWRKFVSGEVIVREGEYGNSAFYVYEGSAKVFLRPLDSRQLGRAPQRKMSTWERLTRLINKNPRGHEFVLSRDVKIDPAFLSDEGILYDNEGKTLRPFCLKGEAMGQDGKPLAKEHEVFLSKGGIFGEIAALLRSPRTATVICDTDSPSTFLELRVQALRVLSKRSAEFKGYIEKLYRERTLMKFLKDSDLFAGCDEKLLGEIIQDISFFSFRPNEVVVRQGVESSMFYLMLSGFVRISKATEGEDMNFHYLKKGDFFGELSLLGNRKTFSTVTAVNNAHIVGIGKDHFLKLMESGTFKQKIEQAAVFREEMFDKQETRLANLSLLGFGIDNHLLNGESIMIINLDRCTRCDDCVRACADTHAGYPRFVREGAKIGNMMFPHSCMHCLDPLCMDGCPSGALHRSVARGEVMINLDTCVGCTLCVKNCIYDNIIPLPVAEGFDKDGVVQYKRNPVNGKPVLKSMKCDLCVETGDPACVRACPQDAMRRLSFDEIFKSQLL